jgi:hypothetical protein
MTQLIRSTGKSPFDAGASPTHQASQRGSGRQLDKPAQILKLPWKLLRDLK